MEENNQNNVYIKYKHKDKHNKYTKHITFAVEPKQFLDLRTKLEFDGFKTSDLLRIFLTEYTNDSPGARQMIEKFQRQFQTKGLIRKRNTELRKAEKTKEIFGLNDSEREDIFDILELEDETGI